MNGYEAANAVHSGWAGSQQWVCPECYWEAGFACFHAPGCGVGMSQSQLLMNAYRPPAEPRIIMLDPEFRVYQEYIGGLQIVKWGNLA